jgi:hypothetical protein
MSGRNFAFAILKKKLCVYFFNSEKKIVDTKKHIGNADPARYVYIKMGYA